MSTEDSRRDMVKPDNDGTEKRPRETGEDENPSDDYSGPRKTSERSIPKLDMIH